MSLYKNLGFSDDLEYLDFFLKTLLPTNHTYDFFVDWNKVKKNVKKYLTEVSLLNSLTKIDDRSERLIELERLFKNYPETINVIPLIIAVRFNNAKKMTVLDIDEYEYICLNFNPNTKEFDIDSIVKFCERSGIIDLFDEIDDLYDYLIGVEVGLDSNARKNRSGKNFENLISLFLKKEIIKHGLTLKEQDNTILRKKVLDFVIYKDNKPLVAIESNFYNTSGSKPLEVARSYVNLNKKLKSKNVKFIWVTDGPAWINMKNPLNMAIREIEMVVNFEILRSNLELIINLIQKD